MSAPDRGSVESVRACTDSVVEVAAAHDSALYGLRADLGHRSERAAIAALRARTEDLLGGLSVLLEELAHRERVLARNPETWEQR